MTAVDWFDLWHRLRGVVTVFTLAAMVGLFALARHHGGRYLAARHQEITPR